MRYSVFFSLDRSFSLIFGTKSQKKESKKYDVWLIDVDLDGDVDDVMLKTA